MISISLERSAEGIVLACMAEGHAGAADKGVDLICAAVSVLIRTAGRTMESKTGVTLTGGAGKPGFADFRLLSFMEEQTEWLKGLGDSLVTGLLDIQDEYPGFCRVDIVQPVKE